jgi:hypothetical protein
MTHLIVDCPNLDFDWSGAGGLLASAKDLAPTQAENLSLLILRGSPATSPEWAGRKDVYWLAEQGLDAAAKLLDLFPGEQVLPSAMARKPSSHFTMGQHYTGDGFSYYVPDMTTYKTYRIEDGDQYLSEWLARAASLGFEAALLESPDANAEGKGFDLDLLEKAKRNFVGRILLSGHATEIVHFERLVAEGGCFAAITPQAACSNLGVREIAELLKPPPKETSPQETEGEAA